MKKSLFIVQDMGVSDELGEPTFMLKSHHDNGAVFTSNPRWAKSWKTEAGAHRWATNEWRFLNRNDFKIVSI